MREVCNCSKNTNNNNNTLSKTICQCCTRQVRVLLEAFGLFGQPSAALAESSECTALVWLIYIVGSKQVIGSLLMLYRRSPNTTNNNNPAVLNVCNCSTLPPNKKQILLSIFWLALCNTEQIVLGSLVLLVFDWTVTHFQHLGVLLFFGSSGTYDIKSIKPMIVFGLRYKMNKTNAMHSDDSARAAGSEHILVNLLLNSNRKWQEIGFDWLRADFGWFAIEFW